MGEGRMILLQSHDHFDQLGVWEPKAQQLKVIHRNQNPELELQPLCGLYTQSNDNFLLLYRPGQDLRFRYGTDEIKIDQTVTAKLEHSPQNNILVLLRGTLPILRCCYHRRIPDPSLEEDLTPFVEEEDFDFGLLVRNVINDQTRQQQFFRVDKNSDLSCR